MPWTKKSVPPAAKNLTPHQKEVFVKVANERLRDGASEGSAIRQGLAVAQRQDKKKD